MLQILQQPWAWYVVGPLIGLTVPTLLLIGNKSFGISSSMRHVCAACVPAKIPFFKYDWKKEIWNLFFVVGIMLGGIIGNTWLANPNPMVLNPATVSDLQSIGIQDFNNLMPSDLFGTEQVFTMKGLIFLIFGGFMVGFGTRYAGGCTSGHSIMGISALQKSSIVATLFFMIGGILSTHLILPFLLNIIK